MRTQDCVLDTVVWSKGAPQEKSGPLSCSPCTLQTSPNNHTTAIYKNSLTTQRLPASSLTGMTGPTENLFRTLWTGASGTISSSTLGRPKVDFHRHRQSCTQVNIKGTDTEMVTSHKYLGAHWNNKLDWTDHTAATYKKGQSRLNLLRKLRSLSAGGTPDNFLWLCGGISHFLWSSLLEQQHLGSRQEETWQIYQEGQLHPGMPSWPSGGGERESRMMDKLLSLLLKESHPLQITIAALGSSFSDMLCLNSRSASFRGHIWRPISSLRHAKAVPIQRLLQMRPTNATSFPYKLFKYIQTHILISHLDLH